MKFEDIKSQEQLDALLEEIRKEEKKKYEEQSSEDKKTIATYKTQLETKDKELKDAQGKIADHDREIQEKDKEINGYKANALKLSVARKKGLPYEAVDFLQGNDEEAIGKSADTLKGILGDTKEPPLARTEEGVGTDDKKAALLNTLRSLEGEE